MRTKLYNSCSRFRQPYRLALVLLASVPLFPEYIAFPLLAAALLFIRRDSKAQSRPFRIGIIGKLWLLYAAYLTLTCTYSPMPQLSFLVSAMWWFYGVVLIAIHNLLTDTERVEEFLFYISIVAGIVGLIACIQYRFNTIVSVNSSSVWAWLDELVFRFTPFRYVQLDYGQRAFSVFPNPNMLAQYLVMVFPFVAVFGYKTKIGRFCIFFVFAGILLSFSRGGYLAIAVFSVVLILYGIRHRHYGIGAYAVGTFLFLPPEVIQRFRSIGGGIASSGIIADEVIGSIGNPSATTDILQNIGAEAAVSDRWRMWLESFSYIAQRPLLGYGAGTDTTWHLFEQVGLSTPHAHNLVLQILLEGGWIAFAILFLLGTRTLTCAIQILRSRQNPFLRFGISVLGFIIGFLIHGMVDYPLTTPRLVYVFAMLLGWIESVYSLYKDPCPPTTTRQGK